MRAKTYAFEADADSADSLKRQALDDLRRAWNSLMTLENLSEDPAELKSVERARGFIDKAFAELEGGKR